MFRWIVLKFHIPLDTKYIISEKFFQTKFLAGYWKLNLTLESTSANADGLRKAASRKIYCIALLTEYNYQAMSVGR